MKSGHSKEPSPGNSKPGVMAGHRKRNAKGISKVDASKIVGPLSFYKKEEARPADDSGSDWDDMEGRFQFFKLAESEIIMGTIGKCSSGELSNEWL
jgi:hypothetical protein